MAAKSLLVKSGESGCVKLMLYLCLQTGPQRTWLLNVNVPRCIAMCNVVYLTIELLLCLSRFAGLTYVYQVDDMI
jgi:hypothetical protein